MRAFKMNVYRIVILGLILTTQWTTLSWSQVTPKEKGFTRIDMLYEGLPVTVYKKSKAGEEELEKPVFVFVQGSLPVPVFFNDKSGNLFFGAVPFSITNELLEDYHFLIISKPGVPGVLSKDSLNSNYMYMKDEYHAHDDFTQNDHLEFYVDRNVFLMSELQDKEWFGDTLVVAGHSQGSHIAAMWASHDERVKSLIFLSGSPLGRMGSMLIERRDKGSNTNSLFTYWEGVVENKDDFTAPKGGDSPASEWSFNKPIIDDILSLKIPALIVYGTEDYGIFANDYLRLQAISAGNETKTFKEYPGLEHNFFPKDSTNNIDYSKPHWNEVISDALDWLDTIE